MKYLVDTNILVYLLNSKSPELQQKLTRRDVRQFGVSSITVAELIYGARKSRKVEQNTSAVIKILSSFELLDFSSLDAFEYGDIRVYLESKGKLIGGNDLLIAAQARRLGLIVITANTGEFTRVPGLQVEDWTR
ncbi:MAG: type II toxin-antitoxin system VapC family toxin [Chitinispirillaceae bacterium]|nr:type II toxin-antitoxin system VapC family toxin [Chitinispirillaceae bacterium]